jgi:hypothetical protein
MSKQDKQAAGYIHDTGTDYQCDDCYKFEPAGRACVEVRGVILPIGGCNTFVKGRPGTGGHVAQKLTQLEAGYMENRAGFSCKRCEYFDRKNWDCRKVNKDSKGPDDGLIHPMACCNNWEKSEVFGSI